MKSQSPAVVLSLVIALVVLAPVVVLVSLASGAELDSSGQSWQLLFNTLAVTGLTVFGATLLGVPLAIATTHCDLPWRSLWLALLVAPLAIPSYIGGFTYFAAFGAGGEIGEVFGVVLPDVRGLWGTALVMSLYTFPLILLTTRAALKQLDGSTVDAARSLGASPLATLWHVVLPRVRSGVAAGALLTSLYAMSDFATPAILGLDTFTRVIYVEYNAFGLDRAALLSLQLLIVIGVVLWLESRVSTDREQAQRPFELPLSQSARWLSLFVILTVLLAAIGMPIWVFGIWLVREGGASVNPALVWNTTYPALIAAMATVVVALPVAYAAARGGLGRWLERMVSVGYGIPGIVMGTALLYVGLRVDWFYQTLALLVVGHVLRFLPLAIGPLRNAIRQSNGNVIAAARGLGAGRFEAFRRVSLPMIFPAAVSGGALVFLEVMRELPLTLMLRPTGLETLTTELWQVYEAGYFGRAAVPGVLLIAISSVAVLLMLLGERRVQYGGAR